jgi:uncharacterized protein
LHRRTSELRTDDSIQLGALASKLEAALADADTGADGSHDLHHARRVWTNAREISRRESAGRPDILIAAAYLHDLVNVPKDDPARSQASRLSAEAAGPILLRLGFDEEDAAAIRHAIIAHSFSAGIKPQTVEAEILQDADRLESLGALGIARTFYIAGLMKSQMFDGADPFALDRNLDDKACCVDHFAVKLLRLPETMCTAAGKTMAQDRAAFMRRFLEQLGLEIGQPCPW